MSGIVVGVDGSEASKAALRWALDEASQHRLPVEVIHVYTTAPVYFSELSAYIDMGELATQAGEDAETLVGDLVAEAQRGRPPVDVTPVAVDAPSPARVLLAHANEATMLVVGTRGHGGFTGLLVGSVSHQCVTHPPCPVTVVPIAT